MKPVDLPLPDRVRGISPMEIRAISEIGRTLPDVIPLWFGESDEPTPDFIKQAVTEALAQDHTFYAPNNGVPALREELSRYMSDLYGRAIDPPRITATASGMNGLKIAMQALVDPGDNVIIVGPVWPNIREAVRIMGGEPRDFSLQNSGDGWQLDLDRLFERCDERTRAIFINSPGNPTGWLMTRDEQQAVLELCRRRGIWLVCDDVYARIVYDRPHAPSFIEIAEPEDHLIAVNSFSKSWSMTGWRLGWITAPAKLELILANLNEYNIASPTTFVQHAAVTAVRDGEPYVADLVARLHRRRDLVCARMSTFRAVGFVPPEAAFYLYFSVEGVDNSFEFAAKLVREAKVGLAPGTAFGPDGQGFLRLCFAGSEQRLTSALDWLEPFLQSPD